MRRARASRTDRTSQPPRRPRPPCRLADARAWAAARRRRRRLHGSQSACCVAARTDRARGDVEDAHTGFDACSADAFMQVRNRAAGRCGSPRRPSSPRVRRSSRSSGAVRVTMPARSSLPSSAHCASRGKSSCGRWSPPCETRIVVRFANSSRQVELDRLPAGREPDQDERAARAEQAEPLLDGRAARRRRRRRSRPAPAPCAWPRTRRLLELPLVEVDRPDLRGAGDAGALDHREADRAAADHRDARALPHLRRLEHRHDAGRDRAADQARLLDRQLARHLHRGDRGHDRVVANVPVRSTGVSIAAVVAQQPARAPRVVACTGAARRAGTSAHSPQAVFQPSTTRSPARGRRRRRRPPRSCPLLRGRAGSDTRGPSRPPRSRAGRCDRRRSPRCGRAPRPARAARRWISSSAIAPRRAEDYTAVSHERSRSRIACAPASARFRSISAIRFWISSSTPRCPPTASA